MFKRLFSVSVHLKDLKASDVQDAQEGGRLPLALIQRLVDSGQDPTKQPLVHRLSQSLHRKISLEEAKEKDRGRHFCYDLFIALFLLSATTFQREMFHKSLYFLSSGVCCYLLLGLRLLHHLPAHFDPGGEDGTGEVGDIDALQVTHLLGSWS